MGSEHRPAVGSMHPHTDNLYPHTDSVYPHAQPHTAVICMHVVDTCIVPCTVHACGWRGRCMVRDALSVNDFSVVFLTLLVCAWLEPARSVVAGGQQVWVTWSSSKLLHKSCLKVDLLGGVISLKQKKSKAGSVGFSVATFHLADAGWSSSWIWAQPWGSHCPVQNTPP